jgi:hypothetical protein
VHDGFERGDPGSADPREGRGFGEQVGSRLTEIPGEERWVAHRHGGARQLQARPPQHVFVQLVAVEPGRRRQTLLDASEEVRRRAVSLPAGQGVPVERNQSGDRQEKRSGNQSRRRPTGVPGKAGAEERRGGDSGGLPHRDPPVRDRRKEGNGHSREPDGRELKPQDARDPCHRFGELCVEKRSEEDGCDRNSRQEVDGALRPGEREEQERGCEPRDEREAAGKTRPATPLAQAASHGGGKRHDPGEEHPR